MTTKQFIEKAIEGGWKPQNPNGPDDNPQIALEAWEELEGNILQQTVLHAIVLDPLAWKAVGKVEGWKVTYNGRKEWVNKQWLQKWHALIDALAEGKSIEEYLKTL